MKVVRLDIYDFKVVLTESDFDVVKDLADIKKISVEDVIQWFVDYGLVYLANDYK